MNDESVEAASESSDGSIDLHRSDFGSDESVEFHHKEIMSLRNGWEEYLFPKGYVRYFHRGLKETYFEEKICRKEEKIRWNFVKHITLREIGFRSPREERWIGMALMFSKKVILLDKLCVRLRMNCLK